MLLYILKLRISTRKIFECCADMHICVFTHFRGLESTLENEPFGKKVTDTREHAAHRRIANSSGNPCSRLNGTLHKRGTQERLTDLPAESSNDQ